MVETRYDKKRGCGWRQPGGLYLVADGPAIACGKLPIPLSVCPTCHAGVKPTRSWTWVDGDALIASKLCANAPCGSCWLSQPSLRKVGLLWVGGQFYPTPEHWTREARQQGVSRRIPALPKHFELGKTWVFVAHREALALGHDKFAPAIFHAFKPRLVEFVVRGSETPAELDGMRKRGITPVHVERVEDSHETQTVFTEVAGVH